MSSVVAAIDLERLLAPISEASPSGVDLRYQPVYSKLRAARTAADRKLKRVDEEHDGPPVSPDEDWRVIEALAAEALATQSKDLQLAVWLLEVQVRVNGFIGAAGGLQLVRRLLEQYWESLYPPLDDDDGDEPLGFRVAVMDWMKDKLPELLNAVPLSDGATRYALLHYEVTQKTGLEKKNLLDEGWPSSERFEKAMSDSSAVHLERIRQQILASQGQLGLLERVTDTRFVTAVASGGGESPKTLLSFNRSAEALENCLRIVDRALAQKRLKDAGTLRSARAEEVPAPAVEERAQTESRPLSAVLPSSREEALARLNEAIEFLSADNSLDPTPFLLDRAVAFGVLFAYEDLSEAMPLPSPPTAVRERLRELYVQELWGDLIRESERFLRASPKQAWLDLHRYVITALEQLGGSYHRAAGAVRAQLRAVLTAYPGLIASEFSDGTPTANQETRQWLRETGLTASPVAATMAQPAAPPASIHQNTAAITTPPPTEEAVALVKAGRLSEALALLQDHVGLARSGRERFLRKLVLAETCLDSGNARFALPLLDELTDTIKGNLLEEWEDKDVITRVWLSIVRCCGQLESSPDAEARGKEAFGQLCRLDISKAFGIDQKLSPPDRVSDKIHP